MPQNAAGTRIEPPVSLPSVSGTSPAASTTAEPPLEPPETRSSAHGLRAEPISSLTEVMPHANSCVCVLPTRIAPGVARPPDRLGVARRDVRVEHRRAVRRAHALRVEQVLDAERDPLERAGLASRPRRLGRDRLLARPLQAERRESADQPVDGVDAGGARVQDLDRRQPSRRELLEEPLDAVICVLGHRPRVAAGI